VWTGLGRGSGICPESGAEVESTSDAASVAAAGRMAPVAPSVATSFVAKGGGKSRAPFATVGVGELEIAAGALDVSVVCATLGGDGGASGGCPTNDDPSGAAFSVCSGSGAFVEAAASGLRKVETFGNSTWYRIKAVIVHKITGTAMIIAKKIVIRRNDAK
jgi:hypothetical protein